jgi:hypothetical protein
MSQADWDEIRRLRESQLRALKFLGWFLALWVLAGVTVLVLAVWESIW